MGTRSVISFEQADGSLKGVYAHWDGYPSHMLPELREIVERDGVVAAAIEILREGGQGWASIDAKETSSAGDRKDRNVPGYGRRFLDAPDQPFRTETDQGEEFWYVIRLDGAVVWTAGDADKGPWFGDQDDDESVGPGFPHWSTTTTPDQVDPKVISDIADAVLATLVAHGISVQQVAHLLPSAIVEATKQVHPS